MQETENPSLEQIRAMLESSRTVEFRAEGRSDIYAWVERTLRQQNYAKRKRKEKGLIRAYLEKMTGMSRAQMTRLIQQNSQKSVVKPTEYRRRRFPRGTLRPMWRYWWSWIKRMGGSMERPRRRFWSGSTRCTVSRNISGWPGSRWRTCTTCATAPAIGGNAWKTRPRAPLRSPSVSGVSRIRADNQVTSGLTQFIRGDLDGVKDVYHINAVDEVTQWQVVGAAAHISEAWLLPVLEAILDQFPFTIRGFHSDNGSEFINHQVAELLNKLLIAQTKSRPRRSNDNGLVEAKNGAVIRKHMGYLHIQAPHAGAIHDFYRDHLNPYLNFHRPCGQAEVTTNSKGKEQRVYRRYATPWEVFQQLPEAAQYLRPGRTLAALGASALELSDTEAARRMQQAKHELFRTFYPEAQRA